MSQVIIYLNGSGICVVYPTGEIPIEEVVDKDVPAGVPFSIVDTSTLPSSRLFRNAWELGSGLVKVNLIKAKVLAHEKRQLARAVELAPLDIKATIPSQAVEAEAERQIIRDKYATIQTQIDAATTVNQLTTIVEAL